MDDKTETVTTGIGPRLELRASGRTWQASGGRTYTVGRANEADIHLDNPRVSRNHAVLQPNPAGWVLVNHSSNGMFVNGQRVERLTITQPITVVLGSASSGEALEIYPVVSPPRPPRPQPVTPPLQRRGGETTVARPPTAVHAIDQISRHHRPRTRQHRGPQRLAGLPPPRHVAALRQSVGASRQQQRQRHLRQRQPDQPRDHRARRHRRHRPPAAAPGRRPAGGIRRHRRRVATRRRICGWSPTRARCC